MSDQPFGTYGYDDDDDDQGQPAPPPQQDQRSNAEWAALRKEKRGRSKAEQELADTRRALAFMQAGIDPSDARLGYFVRGYQGDVSPQAIREAAISAGFVAPPQTGPTPQQQQQLASQQRMGQVAAAGSPVNEGEAAQAQALNEAYAQGGTSAVIAKMVELGIPIQAN